MQQNLIFYAKEFEPLDWQQDWSDFHNLKDLYIQKMCVQFQISSENNSWCLSAWVREKSEVETVRRVKTSRNMADGEHEGPLARLQKVSCVLLLFHNHLGSSRSKSGCSVTVSLLSVMAVYKIFLVKQFNRFVFLWNTVLYKRVPVGFLQWNIVM